MTFGLMNVASRLDRKDTVLSLYHLLDPEVLANPYPLFRRLREEAPVQWDPYLHAWIVTRYADVLEVLHTFSADRTPTPEQLTEMGLSRMNPIAQVMVKQMLFMDAPAHTRLRALASKAFMPAQVEKLRTHIGEIVDRLLDEVQGKGEMDAIAELAEPLPAIVTAEMLGVPVSDRTLLKTWSANFAEMLGNFQHNPDRQELMLRTVEEMTAYFRGVIADLKRHPREGLVQAFLNAEVDGDRFTEEEVIANSIVTMVGGQETTTNLIGNGLLALLRYPEEMKRLCGDLSLIPSAVEEMLRFESPSQHTARLAPAERVLGGQQIKARQAVIAVMAAANRDPERFPDPDRFDIARTDNRHLAFGYAAHFCFGAALARAEGQVTFEKLLRRLPNLRLEPQKLVWRNNLGLRGLTALRVRFDVPGEKLQTASAVEAFTNEPMVPGTQNPDLRQMMEWNNTKKDYPSQSTIHEQVELQAARTPNAIAVEQGSRRLTYAELNGRANQLAHWLREHGVGLEMAVGVCLKRSPELAVALLAVLKAGGACLPLDPEYPADRLVYMVADSKAAVVLSQPGVARQLEKLNAEIVELTPDFKILEGQSRENLRNGAGPDNLAYVIYTSGSTGKPRGVLLTHRGLVNHNIAAIHLYGIDAADRALQFASISFDIAIEETFPTWMAGATLVLRPEEMPLGGAGFPRWLHQQGITVLNLPTAYWHELVRDLEESGEPLPQGLRLVIVGGEKASATAYASWLRHGGKRIRWVNTYGPTEASVIATAYEPDPGLPVPEKLPIGRPIANTRIYILDANLRPVPVGSAGELCIAGPGVARGYLERPEITAQKFVVDPFSSEPGARLYRTGDEARFLPDGQIDFIGRTDFQVKIRGFRVELGEIEAVLAKQSGVREAVVLAREDNGEKRLVAYVVSASSAVTSSAPGASDLKQLLRQQLPDYMVPADVVFLKAFPLTPNGKVNRAALPAPEPVAEVSSNHVAARNETEARLVKIWENVLGRKPVGIHDQFLDLGGHSLLAVRLLRRVERGFGKSLSISAMIQAPTVALLAELLKQDDQSSPVIVLMQREGSKPPLFFVHGMGGTVLRFLELARRMAPDQPFYGIQAQGIDGSRPALTSIDEMADLYLEHLLQVQPEGPYFLGGYSMGGLVAIEMAARLMASEKEVGLLALVDTYPGAPKSGASLMGRFLSLSSQQKFTYLQKRANRYRKGIKRRVDFMMLPQELKDVRSGCALAEHNYRPKKYAGQITLFQASEKALRGLEDERHGWQHFAEGGLETYSIDADHGNILNEPQVAQLAGRLRTCLDHAHANRAASLIAS